jgi:RNA polymerase primary sigma factor
VAVARPAGKKVSQNYRDEETALFRQAVQLDRTARSLLGPIGRAEMGKKSRGKGLNQSALICKAARVGLEAGEDNQPVLDIITQADRLRWEIVERNERFLNYFYGKTRMANSASFDRTDVLQILRLALFEAARRFDPELGFSFRTYATWWVRAKALDNLTETSFGIPKGKVALKIRLLNTIRDYRMKNGDDPKLAQLADFCQSDQETISALLLTDGRILSLDHPYGTSSDSGDCSMTIADMLIDHEAQDRNPDSRIDQQKLLRMIDQLPELEARILKGLLGLGTWSGEGQSLESLAAEIGSSRERIRVKRQEALSVLAERVTGQATMKIRVGRAPRRTP